ncbi:MAG: excinuclease ABC subunit UvrA [Bacteroidales bacterium]|nr:excinuclease ABC subunit UvrA [Bacteroidales bacterium]
MDSILIKGARVNNLKNIDVEIPRNKLVVITGLSGSGKSSLAFDTLYAEGQRRYVESLSSYARQFLGRMQKPDVDYIHGISPAIAIEQKVISTTPRSTVGTSSEIYEYLKLLYARIGHTFSPVSGREVRRHSVSDVVDFVYTLPDDTATLIYAPLEATQERPLDKQLATLLQEGFTRVCIDGEIMLIEECSPTAKKAPKEVLLVIDRIHVHHGDDDQLARVSESVQTAFFEGRGTCVIAHRDTDGTEQRQQFSNRFEADGITFEKPNPNFFSFNNPYGACPSCQGYGQVIGIDEDIVVPDKSLSVYEGAVTCWRGEKMSEWKSYLIKQSSKMGFPIHKPYCDLTEEERDLLWHGDSHFEGIDGFFRWVEGQAYKIQYRVMLSRYRGKTTCPECRGSRLRKDASYVKVGGKSIVELTSMPVDQLQQFFDTLQLTGFEQQASQRLLKELKSRIGYLIDVGLGYLTLGRMSNTLSGGESQRINLATSLGSSLVGSMYILDEPSIGLHPRDTDRLIGVLKRLRDLGNTVIVVEHDEEIIRAADWVIDIGPEAGRLGGEVVYAGPVKQGKMKAPKGKTSYTAEYLEGRLSIDTPAHRRKWRDRLEIKGAYSNNLKHLDVTIPLGVLTVVTGVSGSGKTSLVKHVLYDTISKQLDGAPNYCGHCREFKGDMSRIGGIELIDQNPIGKSTRSNPATYMKAYDEIRQLYAMQPLAKSRGYKPGWFSFNVEGGRCERCEGDGYVTIGMQFMADVHLVCDDCHGTRFKDETLEVLFRGKNISEVLDMTVDQAVDFFSAAAPDGSATPKGMLSTLEAIQSRLKPLQEVGLGYLKLGQSSSSLSGGEAQRIKLASFLIKGQSEKPLLFIFDEPSTGLHFHDIQKLLKSFNTLIDRGHSVLVIEHHPDIIKCADWVIDLGPEGGAGGGTLVFAGTPEELVKCPASHTARFLHL